MTNETTKGYDFGAGEDALPEPFAGLDFLFDTLEEVEDFGSYVSEWEAETLADAFHSGFSDYWRAPEMVDAPWKEGYRKEAALFAHYGVDGRDYV